MALWGGRFAGGSSNMFRQVNDSIGFDQVMATQDMTGSIVWSRALCKAGVLTQAEQAQLEDALNQLIAKAELGELDYLAAGEEDIHSFVEAALTEQLGDVARKLHTGRSRNDQVATDFRLWVKDHIVMLRADLVAFIGQLVSVAQANTDVILPGYTHLQRAQPVRFAHWALAYVEMLKRDLSRLDDLHTRMNQCPLGSGALAGTTYPVDRHEIAAQLGF
ncbi:MAG TPA: argininosuccinate lyase, partial [Glaciecola sp.]|nr:argininosuccinate lyase [Glaciecola sp.]